MLVNIHFTFIAPFATVCNDSRYRTGEMSMIRRDTIVVRFIGDVFRPVESRVTDSGNEIK
jgi:hypothetical protein